MRLWVLVLSLLPLVVQADPLPSVSASYTFSGPWGQNNKVESETVSGSMTSTWNATTRVLSIVAAANFVATGGTRGMVRFGYQFRLNGVEQTKRQLEGGDIRYSPATVMLTRSLEAGVEVRLWLQLELNWGSGLYDEVRYSGWFSGVATQYRKLTFTVTNTGAKRGPAGVWAVQTPGAAMTDAESIGNVVSIDPGGSAVVTHYTERDDSSSYYGAMIDFPLSVTTYGGNPIVDTYARVDGSSAVYFSGAEPLAASKTATAVGTSGPLVDSLGRATGSGATVPTVSTPLGTTAGKVADGSTGPATGKEVTDSANAGIAQAHSDAAALQKSVDAVGSKIDGLKDAVKSGSGTGSGSMSKAEVDAATASAQTAANSDAQAKADKMDEGFTEASTKGENAVSGVRTGVLGQAATAFSTGNVKITTGHSAPGPQKTVFTGNSLMDGIQAEGGGGMDANPFTNVLGWILPPAEITGWALFARQCQLWLAVAVFFVWVVGQVMEAAKTIQQTPPLQLGPGTQIVLRTSILGNSVGVPAAAIMWGVLAVLWTTALVGLPVAIVAVFVDAAGSGPMSLATLLSDAVTAMQGTASATSGSTGGTKLGTALGYVEMWCPLATYVAIFANTLVLRFTALVQIMLGSVVRTLLSII